MASWQLVVVHPKSGRYRLTQRVPVGRVRLRCRTREDAIAWAEVIAEHGGAIVTVVSPGGHTVARLSWAGVGVSW